MSEILIYKTSDKQTEIEVRLEEDTVWLTQQQMASLFNQTKQNISLHINNCFKEKELQRKGTVKESLTVQKEGKRNVSRKIEYYNLDVIISVGYRVKSKRGTQFRQWATQRLKDYLLKGYAVNQKRLEQLQQTVQLISKNKDIETLNIQEAKGLLEIINNYAQSFSLLSNFDSQSLKEEQLNENITYEIDYEEALAAIAVTNYIALLRLRKFVQPVSLMIPKFLLGLMERRITPMVELLQFGISKLILFQNQ